MGKKKKDEIYLSYITRKVMFSAAHRLWSSQLSEEENHSLYGPCAEIHGHNFELEVTFECIVDVGGTGMTVNISRLGLLLGGAIHNNFDHKFLNNIDLFKEKVPTCEVILRVCWELIEIYMEEWKISKRCKLYKLKLHETPKNVFEYYGGYTDGS